MNNTSLTQKLSKHFLMHPSRLKTFAAAILGAMSSGNCQQYSLSRMLESPTCKSGIRRIERLFQKQELTCSSLALFLVEALDFIGLFDLCLDRSNWEFGEKNINYLVLSWRISKELSLPLLFVELDKAANSNTNERIDLIETGTIRFYNSIFLCYFFKYHFVLVKRKKSCERNFKNCC